VGSNGGQYKGSQGGRNRKRKRQRRKQKRRKKKEKREKEKKKKQKKGKTVEVRKVAEEWEIWDEEEEVAKSEAEVKKLVPEKFHRWIKVFGKKQSERMPTRKLWDHAEEREEVREFVKEQLRKGYIWPSKLPQTAPVFFVGKKDGKKRMVQDYRYLNEWTIKNNYPLPLISDVLENIGTKKVFMKMDLR